jgi:2-methylcitrate dehydratase PrpD
MTMLNDLANFVTGVDFDRLSPETIDHVEMHLYDSLGALVAGAVTSEMKPHIDLLGIPARSCLSAPLHESLFLACVATRLTEVDDIEILSCTTPSSVVVPAALCLAMSRRVDGKRFIEALAAGYDLITRLGAAVDGPNILYRGIWPTGLCGPIGAAAVCAKILGLTADQTREALAMALTLTPGPAGRVKTGRTSRWLTLGRGVQNGLFAAQAAAAGYCGDPTLLDGLFQSVLGLKLDSSVLMQDLGREFRVGNISIKPFCTARQALSSIEAFQTLLDLQKPDPGSIEAVEVLIPEQYRQMIDRASPPEDRLGSITSVQYQMALAAFHPEDLYDIHRETFRTEPGFLHLMKKIEVRSLPEYTAMFPKTWPCKMRVRAAGGIWEQEVLTPRGEPQRPLTWQELEQKVSLITRGRLGEKEAGRLRSLVQSIRKGSNLEEVFPALRKFME